MQLTFPFLMAGRFALPQVSAPPQVSALPQVSARCSHMVVNGPPVGAGAKSG